MTIRRPKPLAEYQTPWEAKGEEYDPEKGKAFIHYLLTEAAGASESSARLTDQLSTAQTELDSLKAEKDAEARKGETETDRLNREVAQLKKAAEEAANKTSPETLKLRVALRKGLTDVQARRLVGETEEELEKDADELLASFRSQSDDEDEGGDSTPRVSPKARNSSDPEGGPSAPRWDPEKAADAYVGRSAIL